MSTQTPAPEPIAISLHFAANLMATGAHRYPRMVRGKAQRWSGGLQARAGIEVGAVVFTAMLVGLAPARVSSAESDDPYQDHVAGAPSGVDADAGSGHALDEGGPSAEPIGLNATDRVAPKPGLNSTAPEPSRPSLPTVWMWQPCPESSGLCLTAVSLVPPSPDGGAYRDIRYSTRLMTGGIVLSSPGAGITLVSLPFLLAGLKEDTEGTVYDHPLAGVGAGFVVLGGALLAVGVPAGIVGAGEPEPDVAWRSLTIEVRASPGGLLIEGLF